MQQMSHQVMGYDRAITMFSPDGRLLQVEYAIKTVRIGNTAIGLVCKDGVLLVTDKRINEQLDYVLDSFHADAFILVTDGAEDDQVIPILQSRAPIISKEIIKYLILPLLSPAIKMKNFHHNPNFLLTDILSNY